MNLIANKFPSFHNTDNQVIAPLIPTPYFEIDLQCLDENYERVKSGFETQWPNLLIGYSVKTNALPWILGWARARGAWAEVMSTPEMMLAKRVGYPCSEIIINGPYKGFEAMREVLEAGGVVNLDSFHEIEWLRKNRPLAGGPWKVGLRLNCDLEGHCPGETAMDTDPGRFGFSLENGSFYEAARQIKEFDHVRIAGVHTHHSSSTKSMRVFEALGRLTFESLKIIGHDLEFIDMGGGFFSGKIESPDYTKYAELYLAPLRELLSPEKTALIIEPGAAIVFSPFSYVCSVIDSKEIAGVTIVTTDGSALWMDFGLIGRRFPVQGQGSSEVRKTRQVIVGFSGLERDWLAEFADQAAFVPGDALCFRNAGAYTLALAPLFIQFSPAMIVKHAEGFFYAKEAWGVEEFVRKCFMYGNEKLPIPEPGN